MCDTDSRENQKSNSDSAKNFISLIPIPIPMHGIADKWGMGIDRD